MACTDPACSGPEGLEVLITLTAEDWSVTDKILKSAVSCEREEVQTLVANLCAGSRPRALAARARRTVETESGPGPNQRLGTGVSMSAEALAVTPLSTAPKTPHGSQALRNVVLCGAQVRVLTRLHGDYSGRKEDLAAARKVEKKN